MMISIKSIPPNPKIHDKIATTNQMKSKEIAIMKENNRDDL